MRTALAIARKDLRQRVRDRSALVVGLLAPVAIAGLMSLAFHGVQSYTFTLGILDLDRGQVASAIVRAFDEPAVRSVVTVRSLADERSARDGIARGQIAAALVIPAGFSESVMGARPEALRTLSSDQSPVAAQVVSSVVASFAAQMDADRLSVVTALSAGAPAKDVSHLAALASGLRIPLRSVVAPVGAHELTIISYFSPGMAIFFLLFTISYASRSFFVDRSEGMIERMRAAPVRSAEILVGKALSVAAYGTASLAAIALVTSAAFGASWGAPGPAAVVGLALVLSVVALTALVIGLARSGRQADAIASVVVFGLALLGGNFFLVSNAPPAMRQLALLTPNGWALRAFTDLATIGGGFSTILEPVAAILGFTLVVGVVAVALAPRAVER
ncbi:MAG: ABC transporter permease [Actinomycetota bacterium]|nr:ABC transporter permease [Actinomycetota bacterium]